MTVHVVGAVVSERSAEKRDHDAVAASGPRA